MNTGTLLAVIAAISCFIFSAKAESTNSLSDSELEGRALAQKILAQQPANNYTNTGVLEIRNGHGGHVAIPVEFKVIVEPAGWRAIYSTQITNSLSDNFKLIVVHAYGLPNVYKIPNVNASPTETDAFTVLTGDQILRPFAQSDFWYCDLGLEFFHWPLQKVVKKEFHRNCPCTVLESTNPNPPPNGYSRVVCWIDDDSLGVVEAYAYDVNGKKLKNFYPKNLQKVNGQYQVESMVMENLQTGSRSRLEFDLNK